MRQLEIQHYSRSDVSKKFVHHPKVNGSLMQTYRILNEIENSFSVKFPVSIFSIL